jgi:hypothetical protein
LDVAGSMLPLLSPEIHDQLLRFVVHYFLGYRSNHIYLYSPSYIS